MKMKKELELYLWGEEREKQAGTASKGSSLQRACADLGLCKLEGFKEWKDHKNKKGR